MSATYGDPTVCTKPTAAEATIPVTFYQDAVTQVAHVLPWRAIGGTELATLRLARAAAETGYRSVMVCRTDAPLVSDFFAQNEFPVVVFDAGAIELGGLAARWRESLRVTRALRIRGVKIVHCADVYAGDFFAIAAWLAGFTVVCHVRNRYEWLTRQQRLWIFFVRKLVFVSRDTANRFGRLASGARRLVERRTTVLYDGFEIANFGTLTSAVDTRMSLGIPSDAVIVGMVARLSVQKDHLTLIEAAASVCSRHPYVWFIFIGDDGSQGGAEPAHVQRVKEAIAASPFSDRFVCTGFRSDVPDLIAALDLFVLCTHREGLPLVILEAMGQAKPVIATAVDGIPEIVKHRITGLTHDHEDAAGLADQLNLLLDDASLAAELGQRGREMVSRSFSQEAFTANVAKLYSSVGVEPSQVAHAKTVVRSTR